MATFATASLAAVLRGHADDFPGRLVASSAAAVPAHPPLDLVHSDIANSRTRGSRRRVLIPPVASCDLVWGSGLRFWFPFLKGLVRKGIPQGQQRGFFQRGNDLGGRPVAS